MPLYYCCYESGVTDWGRKRNRTGLKESALAEFYLWDASGTAKQAFCKMNAQILYQNSWNLNSMNGVWGEGRKQTHKVEHPSLLYMYTVNVDYYLLNRHIRLPLW